MKKEKSDMHIRFRVFIRFPVIHSITPVEGLPQKLLLLFLHMSINCLQQPLDHNSLFTHSWHVESSCVSVRVGGASVGMGGCRVPL